MKKFFQWVLILIFGLIALAVLGSLMKSPEQKAADAARQGEAAAPAAPPADALKVSAGDLFRAYDANEIAADAKYKGKALEVTGTVASIDSDFANEPVVQLAVSELQTVGASGLGKDVAAKLSKGQSITLNCTGGGEMVGSPVLDDCTLR